MKKTLLVLGLIIIALAIGFYFLKDIFSAAPPSGQIPPPKGYKDITYIIDGQPVTLVNGYAQQNQPGSAAKIITQYFGNAATGDLNNDKIPDVAFILNQDRGGSGSFYYLAVALSSKDGFKGTNAVLLGDRIAPQTTEFSNNEIIVNYATRKPNEPITAKPSVGVSRYFTVSDHLLVEIQK